MAQSAANQTVPPFKRAAIDDTQVTETSNRSRDISVSRDSSRDSPADPKNVNCAVNAAEAHMDEFNVGNERELLVREPLGTLLRARTYVSSTW